MVPFRFKNLLVSRIPHVSEDCCGASDCPSCSEFTSCPESTHRPEDLRQRIGDPPPFDVVELKELLQHALQHIEGGKAVDARLPDTVEACDALEQQLESALVQLRVHRDGLKKVAGR